MIGQVIPTHFWEYLKEGVLNFIYPMYCEVCGEKIRESKGYSVCYHCMNKIELITLPFCTHCGKPLEATVPFEENALCSDCINCKRYFKYARSVARYQGVIRKCIHLLKFKKQIKLIQPLAELMIHYLECQQLLDSWNINLIVPVPLHKKDLLKRGFNQSALLGEYIANHFSITYKNDLLIKNQTNNSQVGLTKNERKLNVQHVFDIVSPDKSCFGNILLVDDIYTTGATVEACCRTFQQYGFENLYVLTMARGV